MAGVRKRALPRGPGALERTLTPGSRARSTIDRRHDREADAGRAQLLLGADLAGDAACARRDPAVQHARGDAWARRRRSHALRKISGTRVGHRQLEEPRPSRRLQHSQCAVVLASERHRDDVRGDRPRRDGRLHDAGLGRAVRVGGARRTADAGAHRRTDTLHRRHVDPDLAARANARASSAS